MENTNAASQRRNVLVLDGGGVRGLSSLLILQALMIQINRAVARLGEASGELHPHHVFQLVAGTSTGGLIALMLGKMGMEVNECITQYEDLSRVIFGKKHLRGKMTFGLAPARYSGKRLHNCVQNLLSSRQLDKDLSMTHEADRIACAVVCREHCSSSQYSTLKKRAVPICSLPCNDGVICKVCEAARATSAAPTFFPVMCIKDRFFADGGLAHNNPSFAIYFHYTGPRRRGSTRPTPASSNSAAPSFSPHGDLDCSRVRFTNIGTGAKVDEVEPRKRDRLAGLLPGVIRKGVFLKQTLTEIAVNSEEKAEFMRHFQELNPDVIMFERFDANHGVSNIKLDDHSALPDIRKRTGLYLEEQDTKDLLEEVGSAIATDYINIKNALHIQSMQAMDLTSDESRQPLNVSNASPATSLISNRPSSQSNHTVDEFHGPPQNNDGVQHVGMALYPDESQQPPNASDGLLADSSISTGPSSQSDHTVDRSLGPPPNPNNFLHSAKAPLTKQMSHEVSGMGAMEAKPVMVAAPA